MSEIKYSEQMSESISKAMKSKCENKSQRINPDSINGYIFKSSSRVSFLRQVYCKFTGKISFLLANELRISVSEPKSVLVKDI